MEPATVPIADVRVRGRGALWRILFVLLFLTGLLVFVMRSMIELDMSLHGASLGEALWTEHNRRVTVTVTVLGVMLLTVLAALVAGAPRSRARREVRVSHVGLELVAHPKAWFRGRRALLPWDNVQIISAEHAVVAEWVGRSRRRVAREALDVYLFREVRDLPDFAGSAVIDASPIEDVRVPAVRVRIAGPGNTLAASVRELATAVDAVRPDVFYQGSAVDQWFTPAPLDTTAPAPAPPAETSVSGPAPDTVATPPTAGFAPPAPLWLDLRVPPKRTFATLAVLVAIAVVSYVPIDLLATADGGILVGLLGLVLMVPFLVGLIGAGIMVLALPRSLARVGIRIDAEGIELVEKRRRAVRGLVRARIPWSDVQAIIARESAVLDEHGLQRAERRSVTDLYLRGDTAFRRPGVGLSVEVSGPLWPDSARTRSLVDFPAVRLRLPHTPKAARATDAAWRQHPQRASLPRTLPGAQLRAALRAARPELCHGFDSEPVRP